MESTEQTDAVRAAAAVIVRNGVYAPDKRTAGIMGRDALSEGLTVERLARSMYQCDVWIDNWDSEMDWFRDQYRRRATRLRDKLLGPDRG